MRPGMGMGPFFCTRKDFEENKLYERFCECSLFFKCNDLASRTPKDLNCLFSLHLHYPKTFTKTSIPFELKYIAISTKFLKNSKRYPKEFQILKIFHM